MSTSDIPVARFRPSIWSRLTPWGPMSLALIGLGAIGLMAPILGILKVGLPSVLTSLSTNAALTASAVGLYGGLFLAQALPGLLSRREIRILGDRIEVREGGRVHVYPLLGLQRVVTTHHIVALQTDLHLIYRSEQRSHVSGRLMGTQISRLSRILESDLS